jgi:hypothetical protein
VKESNNKAEIVKTMGRNMVRIIVEGGELEK